MSSKKVIKCQKVVKKSKSKPKPKKEVKPPTKKSPPPPKEPVKLRERSWDGLSPMLNPSIPSGPVEDCGKDHFRPIPPGVEPPKVITRDTIFDWVERLLDYYEGRGIWLTNSALKSWRGWLIISSMKQVHNRYMTKEEADLTDACMNEILRSRKEPYEFTAEYANAEYMRRLGLSKQQAIEQKPVVNQAATVPVEEAPPKVKKEVKPAKTIKKVKGLDLKVSEGHKGGKRYFLNEHPITSVIRWMGSEAWTKKEVQSALDKLGAEVMEATVMAQISQRQAGR